MMVRRKRQRTSHSQRAWMLRRQLIRYKSIQLKRRLRCQGLRRTQRSRLGFDIAQLSSGTIVYQGRDNKLCLVKNTEGHLVCVNTDCFTK